MPLISSSTIRRQARAQMPVVEDRIVASSLRIVSPLISRGKLKNKSRSVRLKKEEERKKQLKRPSKKMLPKWKKRCADRGSNSYRSKKDKDKLMLQRQPNKRNP